MARIFFGLSKDKLLESSQLEKVCNFFKENALDKLFTKNIRGFGGRLKGVFIFRNAERSNFFISADNKIQVFLDGKPIKNGTTLNAEKIYQLYKKKKDLSFVSDFDGGFICSIFDEENGKIIVVRDRVGLKPFYYFNNDLALIFSSNAGAIVRSQIQKRFDYNKKIVTKYAISNFRSIYGSNESFFQDIFLVRQGSYIEYDFTRLIQRKYWDWNKDEGYFDLDENTLNEIYVSTINDSIETYYSNYSGKDNIIVSLSGGIDSGTVIGALHKLREKRVDAASLSYTQQSNFDESELIAFSVRDHADTWYDIKVDDTLIEEELSKLYENYDVPLATVSVYGYHYLYRRIRELGYESIFTGAGGDQLQAGNYPCFLYYLADLWVSDRHNFEHEANKWIKNHSTKQFPKSLDMLQDFFNHEIDSSNVGQLKRNKNLLLSENILNKDNTDYDCLYSNVVDNYGSYLRSYTVQEVIYEALAPGVEAGDTLDWTIGTSARSPLFSKDIIDLGWKLPGNKKIKNGINKVLSRKNLRGICSKEILDRVDKSGFNAPFDIWTRDILKDYILDIFSSKKFLERGIYDGHEFKQVLADHLGSKDNHMMFLWQALNLELWFREWIDIK